MQPVDIELIAHFLKQTQLRFGKGTVRRRHIAGQRVTGFKQAFRQVVADQAEKGIKPVFLLEQVKDDLGDRIDPVIVIARKDRQKVHCRLDLDQFRRANVPVRRRDGDHQGQQTVLRTKRVVFGIVHGDTFLVTRFSL